MVGAIVASVVSMGSVVSVVVVVSVAGTVVAADSAVDVETTGELTVGVVGGAAVVVVVARAELVAVSSDSARVHAANATVDATSAATAARVVIVTAA
ncbi:hypothetical protein [Ilumatobacter sp.]|uniref:hypothetical protein n=1 Tax=Ilumatobacter sp. TaxID=1967498 RepID=UPI003AF8DEF4